MFLLVRRLVIDTLPSAVTSVSFNTQQLLEHRGYTSAQIITFHRDRQTAVQQTQSITYLSSVAVVSNRHTQKIPMTDKIAPADKYKIASQGV